MPHASGACASPLRARTRRSQAPAAPHPQGQAPLCPASVFASRLLLLTGRAGDAGRYLYRPGGPPPTHTHALGSRPSLDRFAAIASRNPSTPDFSDVLHEQNPLSTFSILLSARRYTSLQHVADLARSYRCADLCRFITAYSPGNPPIRRVDLSATRHPRLPVGSGRHVPDHRSFRKEHNRSSRRVGLSRPETGKNVVLSGLNRPARPAAARSVSVRPGSVPAAHRPTQHKFESNGNP